jgi:hypothetical protein
MNFCLFMIYKWKCLTKHLMEGMEVGDNDGEHASE